VSLAALGRRHGLSVHAAGSQRKLLLATAPGAEGKAWLIYRWQTQIRAGAVARPRRAVLPGLDIARPSTHALALTVASASALPRGHPSQVVSRPSGGGIANLPAPDARAKGSTLAGPAAVKATKRCVCATELLKVSIQSRFDARSCPLCREHPCRPHGAPGSDDALQAGAPSMPALLHHTLHLPQLPRCHPPISLSMRILVGLSIVLSVPCMRKATPFSLRQRLARPIGPPYGDPSVTARPVLWGRQPFFEPHLISPAISVFRYGLAVFRSI
jgi:hypothetical protein